MIIQQDNTYTRFFQVHHDDHDDDDDDDDSLDLGSASSFSPNVFASGGEYGSASQFGHAYVVSTSGRAEARKRGFLRS